MTDNMGPTNNAEQCQIVFSVRTASQFGIRDNFELPPIEDEFKQLFIKLELANVVLA